MPSVLKKKQAAKDKAGKKLAAKGLREYTVKLRTYPALSKELAEKYARLGQKPPASTPSDLLLTPPPVVRMVSLHRVQQSGGMVLAGDIRVEGISRSALFEARVKDPTTVWVVEGPDIVGEFSMIDGQLERHDAEWRATLKKKGEQRP